MHQVLEQMGEKHRVLVIPPDHTRYHSRAGLLTRMIHEYYGDALKDILPALGTHTPMTGKEIRRMFPGIPQSLFRVHNWRKDVVTLGEVPASFVEKVSHGRLHFSWPAQVNRLVREGGHDLVISVGQVVPHEVAGMANYNKNLFVGTGGSEGINRSHYLGAVYGMEQVMGRPVNPVREVLDYASEHLWTGPDVIYILTVVGRKENGELAVKGLFIGDDREAFLRASELSLQVNFTLLEHPLRKVVVYLDPEEFKSTWLGNKGIYRTRMAMADGGELIILAPGIRSFGEDSRVDSLIRKHGYRTASEIIGRVEQDPGLQQNLSAAAHLIHGSPENRFRVSYAAGHLSREEIESVGFEYLDPREANKRYPLTSLKEGMNRLASGEELFFVPNPALGLWSTAERFKNTSR